jgi:DNA polymerase III epsilon subunit family exonuclease
MPSTPVRSHFRDGHLVRPHQRTVPTTSAVSLACPSMMRDPPTDAVDDDSSVDLTAGGRYPFAHRAFAGHDATTRLADMHFAVLDTETSGLPGHGHLIEVAVVRVTGAGKIISRFHSRIRPPDGKAGPTHIHGITEAHLVDAPGFDDIADDLARHIDGSVIVAHNAEFDVGFLTAAYQHCGWDPPRPARVDSLRMARDLHPEQHRHTLAAMCETYEIDPGRAHSAAADTEATTILFRHLCERGDISHAGQLRHFGRDGAAGFRR